MGSTMKRLLITLLSLLAVLHRPLGDKSEGWTKASPHGKT
jgi:hypothetical protein